MFRLRSRASVPFLLVLVACQTTMVPVDGTSDDSVRVAVSVGDTVRVLTKYGERPTFEVTSVTEVALVGDDHHIPYNDMAFVEIRHRETKPGNVAGVILVFAAGAVLVEGLENVGPGFPSVP